MKLISIVKIPREVIQKIVDDPRLGGFCEREPDKQSGSDGPSDMICAYRTPDNHACAVGCLISDKTYNAMIEANVQGNNISCILARKDFVSGLIYGETGLNELQLEALQSLHDAKASDFDPTNAVKEVFNRLLQDGFTTGYTGRIELE
jgi:hypothetical protein